MSVILLFLSISVFFCISVIFLNYSCSSLKFSNFSFSPLSCSSSWFGDFDFSICSVCICYYSLSQILCFIYSLLLFLICDCFNIYFYSFPYPFYSTNFFYPSSCGFCSSLFPLLPIRSYYRLLFHPATSILLLWRNTWCAWKAWASWSTRSWWTKRIQRWQRKSRKDWTLGILRIQR